MRPRAGRARDSDSNGSARPVVRYAMTRTSAGEGPAPAVAQVQPGRRYPQPTVPHQPGNLAAGKYIKKGRRFFPRFSLSFFTPLAVLFAAGKATRFFSAISGVRHGVWAFGRSAWGVCVALVYQRGSAGDVAAADPGRDTDK